MGTPTYQPIANITLGSNAASVTFSGITQAYRDLVIISNQLNTVDAGDGILRFNSDTSNYSRVIIYTAGTTPASAADSNFSAFVPKAAVGSFKIDIMDYSATDKHKSILSRSGEAGQLVYVMAGRWASNSAITSIYLAPNAGSWAAGATFGLYGVIA